MPRESKPNPIEPGVSVATMRKKSEYLLDYNGKIDRIKFRPDIIRCARERGVSIPTILAEFFNGEQFTKREMGRFALNVSSTGELVEGSVLLMHALGVTAETAPSMRILEDYIGVSTTDPYIWGVSWIIDSAMNWPPGTSLKNSRVQLAKI